MKRFLVAVAIIASLTPPVAARADEPRHQRVLLILPSGPLLVELALSIDEQPFAGPDAPSDAFAVQGQAFLAGRTDGSQLRQLLDTDGNGSFSDAEIDAAPARLRSRDADDNDVVTLTEIAGFGLERLADARAMGTEETIVALDASTDWDRLRESLAARFDDDEQLPVTAFRLVRRWAETLDADRDGDLSADELEQLSSIDAPLALDVALGTRTRLRETVVVAHVAEELKRIARVDRGADGKVLIDLLSARIEIIAPNPKPKPRSFAGQATAYVANFDKDKNGYLEAKEVTDPALAAQFAMWDADQNGHVYAEEIRAALEKADLPNWQKVSVAALLQGADLFAALDDDGDQKLGRREIDGAVARLQDAAFDEQQTLRLAIARGNETYRYLSKGTTPLSSRLRTGASASEEGPGWFAHMDTNRDGDVSQREFLGTPEQFSKLDANGDAFIDRLEAQSK